MDSFTSMLEDGKRRQDRGQHVEAIRAFTSALEVCPDETSAAAVLYLRARSLAALGRRAFVMADLTAAIERAPELRARAAGEAVFARWRQDPYVRRIVTPDEDIHRAHELLSRGAPADAYRFLMDLKPTRTEDPAYFYYLSIARWETGDLEGALASSKRCAALLPTFPDAHFNIGAALEALGRPDEAMASYRAALGVEPDFANASFNLGLLLARRGRRADALEIFTNALGYAPQSPMLLYKRAEVFAQDGNVRDMLQDLSAAIQLDPQAAPAALENEHFARFADLPAFRQLVGA